MTEASGSIDELYTELSGQKFPPVHQWEPAICRAIDMRILRNGDWHHEGSKIQRPAMVKLFSTVLRREGENYFLVTPAEKLKIAVDDAPFTAVSMDVYTENNQQILVFTNNVGDKTIADAEHRIFVNYNEKGEPAPYIEVRNKLCALITRPVYYEMCNLCVENKAYYSVLSCGEFFQLGPITD